MYVLLPQSLSSRYWPFPRSSRTISLSLAFSLDLSELLKTMSPMANVLEGRSGLRCLAALLLCCLLMISFCAKFRVLPDSMSLPVQSSDDYMPVQRSLAFRAEIASASSHSDICPPVGEMFSMAFWTSLLFLSATGFPFLFCALHRSMVTPMSVNVLLFETPPETFGL